eukprot:6180052-Pleurochrysis_carterae.AAC.3
MRDSWYEGGCTAEQAMGRSVRTCGVCRPEVGRDGHAVLVELVGATGEALRSRTAAGELAAAAAGGAADADEQHEGEEQQRQRERLRPGPQLRCAGTRGRRRLV